MNVRTCIENFFFLLGTSWELSWVVVRGWDPGPGGSGGYLGDAERPASDVRYRLDVERDVSINRGCRWALISRS